MSLFIFQNDEKSNKILEILRNKIIIGIKIATNNQLVNFVYISIKGFIAFFITR